MPLPFQKGFIRLEGGSLGETTFMKKNGQYRAKEKIITASKHTWKYDARFEGQRNIASEFSTIVAAAKIIRSVVRSLIIRRYPTTSNRLRKLMAGIVAMDNVSVHGKRAVHPANLLTVSGFNFNSAASLRSVFNTPYSTSLDRATGKALISIPPCIPSERIIAPKGTTHFKLVAAASAIDFANDKEKGETFSTGKLPWDDEMAPAINMQLSIPSNSTLPVFLYLGIMFTQEIGPVSYAIADGKKDALCIIDVHVPQ